MVVDDEEAQDYLLTGRLLYEVLVETHVETQELSERAWPVLSSERQASLNEAALVLRQYLGLPHPPEEAVLTRRDLFRMQYYEEVEHAPPTPQHTKQMQGLAQELAQRGIIRRTDASRGYWMQRDGRRLPYRPLFVRASDSPYATEQPSSLKEE